MFNPNQDLFHPIDIRGFELPKQFTFPFYYTPHPLCIKASEDLQAYLHSQSDFKHNFGLDKDADGLAIGKMFGVMLVEAPNGAIGYLVGFSGKLAEKNHISGFVPPIFDTLNESGFYKKGEHRLNQMNDQIATLEKSQKYIDAKTKLRNLQSKAEKEIEDFKSTLKVLKMQRNNRRSIARLSLKPKDVEAFEHQLDQESISLHYKLKQLKLGWKERITQARVELKAISDEIDKLKSDRKQLSGTLQRRLHQSYSFLNSRGESKDLLDIFESHPPAAAGECAAPKLFQYAYKNRLKPLAMAEFWWGASPPSQVRKHKNFYPACRSKCEPILGHMMKGLDVEKNPMLSQKPSKKTLDIIYEDAYLLILNKPEEILSVPGKRVKDSILTRLQNYLPEVKGPLLVHRLDMSTSGILVAAKNEKTHKNLQKQFINRTVNKRYVALLEGKITDKKGVIDLPLRVDLDNRPTQLVCNEYGKPAQTKYEVVGIDKGKTRIYFYPITGRTHQLRVHAAHHLGLNTPIVGDDLYGNKGKRLHLHAEEITFEHPVKKKKVTFKVPSPF